MKIKTICLFVLLGALVALHAQTNRALLVAIDTYPDLSGWGDIHASNDIQLVVPMLRQNGYLEKNILILQNDKAIKSAIINALADLLKKSAKGDFIYIHFSCHGQQMADDNGDEADGLDEALIPYDAKRRYVKGEYEGQHHLRDDELGKWLEKIRAKVTNSGNVVVLIVACHSGTATRENDDEEYVRGTSYVFAPAGYEYSRLQKSEEMNLHLTSKGNVAPITILSACRADEVNYEYRDPINKNYYGSLSYAFCNLLLKNVQPDLSNNYFFSALENELTKMLINRKRKQTPHIETTTDGKGYFRIAR
jgi:hypothetical protein